MERQDLRNINQETQNLQDALDELEDLYTQSQKDGVTVEDSAFEDAQEQAKDAINKILHYADDIVDRTDKLEMPNGERELPNPALERVENKDIPGLDK